MRGLNTKVILAGAVGLASGLLGSASVIASLPTVTESAVGGGIVLALTDFDSPGAGVSSLQFPKFSLPGTVLKKVTLTLNGDFETTVELTNNSASNQIATFSTDLYLIAQDALTPNGNLTVDSIPVDQLPLADGDLPLNPQLLLQKGTGVKAFTPGQERTFTYTESDSQTEQYTNPVVLAEFTGASGELLTLNVSARSWNVLGQSGSNFTAIHDTWASIGGTVTYEYASVPEATTMILGGMAVMPILMQRRRQRGAAAQA